MKTTRRTAKARSETFVAYVRVSTATQDLGPDVQRRAVEAWGALRSHQVVVVEEQESARNLKGRPVLRELLARLAGGDYAGLVVSKLDRLCRSTVDFLALVEQAQRQGWALVILDMDIDTGTAAGRLVATMFAALAEWERGVISERTTAALAAKRQREPAWRPGRPVEMAPATRKRIVAERAAGKTFAQIAADLQADGVPTARGGRWYASTAQRVVAAECHSTSLACASGVETER